MENLIYRKIIVPASDLADGETPTELTLTKEVNGYLILLSSHSSPCGEVRAWYPCYLRDDAIESAVAHARSLERRHTKQPKG